MGQAERVRFGRIVRARREELGLTQDDIVAMGGPSDTTQTRIEKAEGPEPKLATWNKYDGPLRWVSGSAARVWAGGDPELVSPRPAEALALGPEEVPISLERLTGLLRTLAELQQIVDADSEPKRADVAAVADDLKRFVSQITGLWITDFLERNAGPNRTVHPIIEFTFGEHLAIPVDPDDPDAEEKLYRRWLAHREGIPPELKPKFARRLRRAR